VKSSCKQSRRPPNKLRDLTQQVVSKYGYSSEKLQANPRGSRLKTVKDLHPSQ
jgi:hypothetical protein